MKPTRIFYDVDTQVDFMNKDGALYVPDAELIKPNLEALTKFARENAIPIIGSVDRHFGTPEYKEREGELARWGGPFPDHCMAGTKGQEKIKETEYVGDRSFGDFGDCNAYIPNRLKKGITLLTKSGEEIDKGEAISRGELKLFWGARQTQLYFEKQSYDVFTNPAFEFFLEKAEIKEAVVYGVATDYCVKAAVLGMQERGIQCYVIEDAIKGVAPDTTQQALDEMIQSGAKFVTTKQILEERI